MRARMLVIWLGLGSLLAGGVLFLGLHLFLRQADHGGKVHFPEVVLPEDFQRPLDQDLTELLLGFEETGVSKFLDTKVLKPYFDDLRTRQFTVEGIELRPEQFPDRQDLYRAVDDCAKILGIPKPRVFIVDSPGANACTVNMADPVIVLSSSLIRRLRDPAELRFVLGHEMGHIKCRHVKLMVVLKAIVESLRRLPVVPDDVALLPFLPVFKWAREAEMSADNAGLICAQSRDAAERALICMLLNLDLQTTGRINVDEFLKQREAPDLSKFSEVVLYWRELLQDHPFVADRISELRKYEQSRRYQHLWEGT